MTSFSRPALLCLLFIILLSGCNPSPPLYPKSEEADSYHAKLVAFTNDIAKKRLSYADSLQKMYDRTKRNEYGKRNVCDMHLAMGHIMLFADAHDLMELSAIQIGFDLDASSANKKWMISHTAMINQIKTYVEGITADANTASQDAIYTGEVKAALKDHIKDIEQLLQMWKDLVSQYATGDANRMLFSGLPKEYAELNKTTMETVRFMRGMGEYYRRGLKGLDTYRGDCLDPVMLHFNSKAAAAKVFSSMQWACMLGLLEHDATLRDRQLNKERGNARVGVTLQVLESIEMEFPNIASRYPEPTAEAAAMDFSLRLEGWRKSLQAALAKDAIVIAPVKFN